MLINILVMLLIGLVIGFLAQQFMGGGLGWGWSIVLGLIGSFVGGFIFQALGISTYGLLGQIIAGVIGACIVLFGARRLRA
ncbi:MAG: GlsB/YeaQ/YmgE family stress response membrane protein [Planctomycetes bacterium]|nr:GlsB/YeaQ/YmgE family stress response membrane protein [Planctomycetota bacterium]